MWCEEKTVDLTDKLKYNVKFTRLFQKSNEKILQDSTYALEETPIPPCTQLYAFSLPPQSVRTLWIFPTINVPNFDQG